MLDRMRKQVFSGVFTAFDRQDRSGKKGKGINMQLLMMFFLKKQKQKL